MSLRVLFLCTGNAARSQMAEAILRHISHGRIDVFSAGTVPQRDVHPMAREPVKRILHTDITGQHPKSMKRFVHERFDYIITVCDRAAESCPVFPGDPERIHWSFDDPVAVEGTQDERQRAFDAVARQLVGRMRIWMSLPKLRHAVDA
jgi:protein-tyrosine-phosphatase